MIAAVDPPAPAPPVPWRQSQAACSDTNNNNDDDNNFESPRLLHSDMLTGRLDDS